MQNCMTIHFSKTFCSHVNFLVAWEFLILRPFLPSVTQSLFFKEIADICLNTRLFRQMEFWIQKYKLRNNTKVGFHFQATTEWHFQCCLPNLPTVLCWLCQALQDSSSVCSGSCCMGAERDGEVGKIPPGSLQEPVEGMRRKCGMFLEIVVKIVVYFSFFSLSFSKSSCFPPALLPGSVCASRQVLIPQLPPRVTHHCVPIVSLSRKLYREGEAATRHFWAFLFSRTAALAACGTLYLRLVQNISFFVFLWASLIGGL